MISYNFKDQIKTIYLDLDNTLVDTDPALAEAVSDPDLVEKLKLADIQGKRNELFFSIFETAVKNKCFEIARPLPFYYYLTTPLEGLGNKNVIQKWQEAGISVEILSSVTKDYVSSHSQISTQKLHWLQEYKLDHLPLNLVKGAYKKQEFVTKNPGLSLLIDDSLKNCKDFQNKGALAIQVTDFYDVSKLEEALKSLSLLPWLENT